jgi:hypothetical protein
MLGSGWRILGMRIMMVLLTMGRYGCLAEIVNGVCYEVDVGTAIHGMHVLLYVYG